MKGQVMNIRKWSGIATALALVAGLAACAPAADDPNAERELLIWDTGILGKDASDDPYADNAFLNQMALEFELENPGVKVTVVQQGGDITANAAAFQAAAIAGTGPDIRVQYAGGPTSSFGDFFVDLEPLIPAEILDSMAGQYVNREGYDSSGRLLGMTYGAGNLFVVFQNADVLTEAGVDPTVVPKTWEELIANAQKVADNTDKNGFYTGNLEGYPGAWFITAIVGGELGETAFTDMYAGKIPVDDPAMVKAYQAFADWGKSGVNNPDAAQVSAGGQGFYAGEAAYYLVGSWENNGIVEAFGEDGPVTSFFIPTLAGAKYPLIGAGGPEIAISITESSKNKDLAVEFLKFLARPEHQDRFVKIYQTQGSNHVDGDPSMILNPRLKEQFEQLAVSTDGITFAFDSVMPQATIDLFYRVNAGVFSGAVTPADAVAQLKASYEQEISK
jgi:raffinose/stachyose/melibiose transport system substrate-binding protein